MKGKIFAMVAVFAMVAMAFGTINAEAKPDEKVKVVADCSDQHVMMGVNTINVETQTVIITRLIDTGNDGTFDKMIYVIKNGNEVMSGTEDVEINTVTPCYAVDIDGPLGMFRFSLTLGSCWNLGITIEGMGGYIFIQGTFSYGSPGIPIYESVHIVGDIGNLHFEYTR